jgi:hypothetical protein
MKQIKINLKSFTNNYPKNILSDFDREDNNGLIKSVNTFIINTEDNDSIEVLQKKISAHLFKIIHDSDINWTTVSEAGNGICMFCFNNTVALDPEDKTIIQCSTCNRIYNYKNTFSSIPLPSMKYLFLKNKTESIIYTNDYSINSPVEYLENTVIDYDNLNVSFFNDLSVRFINDGPPQIVDNSVLKLNNSDDEYDLIYFPDFYLFLDNLEISDTIKQKYTAMFWNVDYREYALKIKNSFDKDPNIPNFIIDNNLLNTLNKTITLSTDTVIEYNKLELAELDNLKNGFSQVIIKVFQDNETPFINLLRIFHLLEVSDKVPFMSLYIDRFNKKSYKILRSLSDDLSNKWIDSGNKTKQLLFKIKIRGSYFTMILTNTNMIKILLPITTKLDIKITLFEEIAEKVNNVISEIAKLSYKEKNYPDIDIQKMSTNVKKWGKDNITEFSPLSIITSFQKKDIDMLQLGIILECLKPYVLTNKATETEITFLYIYDIDSKQGIRYDKYLWNTFKYYIRTNKPLGDYEDIKLQFGQEFDLDGNQLNLIFSQWVLQNQEMITKIIKNHALVFSFKPILDGVAIKIERIDDFFNIHIQGIKFWHQEKDIMIFFQKLFTLQDTIKTNDFFKNNCGGIITKNIAENKGTNFKIALKRFLPDIFWEANKLQNDAGYPRKCQKPQQPKIFSDEASYLSWMEEQGPKNLTDLQKIFTRECPTFTSEQLAKGIKDLNLPVPKGRSERCVSYQKAVFNNRESTFTNQDLIDILNSLLLPIASKKQDKLDSIIRYFNIQTFLNEEDIDNVYPNPQTFIIKRNNQNYYLACPNGLQSTKSINSKYMGFLDINDHPLNKELEGNDKRKYCVPCCTQKINTKRVDFCSAVIDYDEFQLGKVTNSEYIKNDKKFPLLVNRYGHLPQLLHEMLNNNFEKSKRLGLIKDPLYLRRGNFQNNFSFLQAILSTLPDNELSISNALFLITTKLDNTLFRSLNSGNLFWEFNGSIAEYKNTMNIGNINDIDPHHLWDLISRPGILTQSGFNIIIYEIKERELATTTIDELHLMCPRDQEINHFFNDKKPTIMLYHKAGQYEPIIYYISNSKQISIYNFEDTFFNSIKTWYLDACSVLDLDTSLTAKSLINRFKNSDSDRIKLQLIDAFNKVQMIITTSNLMIPTIPSGLDTSVPFKKLTSENMILQDYNIITPFLKQNNILVSKIIVNDLNKITHIILKNDIFLPIIPLELPIDNQLPIAKKLIDYTGIDEAILSDIDPLLFTEIIEGDYFKESYEMFRFHFANFITQIQRTELKIKPIDANIVKNIVDSFVSSITIKNVSVPATFNKSNIYRVCKDIDTIHCENGKLVISENNIQSFTKRLINELKNYKLKSNELINNTIDPIVDNYKFINTINHVYL